ncbi:MAG TPA: glycosyltransferase family 4 protein [Chroococcidiopsis sp.]
MNEQQRPLKVLMLGAGLDVQGGITSVERLILECAPPGLEVRLVATFAKGSAGHNIRVFLKAIAAVVGTALRRDTDVLHIHFAERGSTLRKMILCMVAITLRQRFILHAHGAAYEAFYAKLPSLVQGIVAGIFRHCVAFIALSKTWQTYYQSAFRLAPSQVTVLYNPVRLPATTPDRSDRPQVTFLFLGRIGQRGGALDVAKSVVDFPRQDKGAFDLIRAFAELPRSDRQQARLILAGNGDVEQAQQLVAELGLTDQITIYSWLNAEERDHMLANADAFVLPSYHEGLPMSMLEAMAWGLPVIVTPVGGIPEVITHRHNGWLVTPGDRPQLINALQELIQHPDLRDKLGYAAKDSAQKLEVSHYMKSLTALYASVVT